MKVYVADWTADTQHLTCEQDGAYWRLCRAMWRAGGSLPNDPEKLCRIVGLPLNGWAEISGDVISLFRVSGSSICHTRLQKEAKAYTDVSSKRKAAGAIGGRSKAKKYNGNPEQANAKQVNGNSHHNQNQIDRTLSLNETESSIYGDATLASAPEPRSLSSPIMVERPLTPEQLAHLKTLGIEA